MNSVSRASGRFAALLVVALFLAATGFQAVNSGLEYAAVLSAFASRFFGILVEALPFLLLGCFTSGLIEAFVDKDDIARIVPRHRLTATIAGAFLGLAFPVGECGVVPVARRLMTKGAPVSLGVAFLLAAPVVNPIVFASAYIAFGIGPIFALRFAIAILVAITVGLVVGTYATPSAMLRMSPPPGTHDGAATDRPTATFRGKLRRTLQVCGAEFLQLGPWLFLGAALATLMLTLLPQDRLLTLATGAFVSIVALQILAYLVSAGSTADSFLALAFVKSFSTGALVSYLNFGAMVDLKSTMIFAAVFRRRFLALLILLPFALNLLAGMAIAAWESGQPTRVAYLYPASLAKQDIWIADIDNPDAQQQLTFSDHGVDSFDFSPDGRWLAFAELTETGWATLRLLNLSDRRLGNLVDCVALQVNCRAPAFSPDGAKLAYERAESDGSSRIWLVDMISESYETRPLFADEHLLGHSPAWSRDSNSLYFYSDDPDHQGITIYEFVPSDGGDVHFRFVSSSYGTMGTVSPSGQQIIFPDLVRRDGQFFSHLQLADLAKKEFGAFTDPDGPTDDVAAQWSPDGSTVAIARRYTDSRWTPGYQLYLRDFSDDAENLTRIAYDPKYNTSYFRWHPSGDRLALQRFPLSADASSSDAPARPEVWIHDLEGGVSRKLIEDAYLPQWLPDQATMALTDLSPNK